MDVKKFSGVLIKKNRKILLVQEKHAEARGLELISKVGRWLPHGISERKPGSFGEEYQGILRRKSRFAALPAGRQAEITAGGADDF